MQSLMFIWRMHITIQSSQNGSRVIANMLPVDTELSRVASTLTCPLADTHVVKHKIQMQPCSLFPNSTTNGPFPPGKVLVSGDYVMNFLHKKVGSQLAISVQFQHHELRWSGALRWCYLHYNNLGIWQARGGEGGGVTNIVHGGNRTWN